MAILTKAQAFQPKIMYSYVIKVADSEIDFVCTTEVQFRR